MLATLFCAALAAKADAVTTAEPDGRFRVSGTVVKVWRVPAGSPGGLGLRTPRPAHGGGTGWDVLVTGAEICFQFRASDGTDVYCCYDRIGPYPVPAVKPGDRIELRGVGGRRSDPKVIKLDVCETLRLNPPK